MTNHTLDVCWFMKPSDEQNIDFHPEWLSINCFLKSDQKTRGEKPYYGESLLDSSLYPQGERLLFS